MRETFSNLLTMINYYYFLKYKMESCPTNFPDEKRLKAYIQAFNPVFARSQKEEKLAFMGDIENYLDNILRWWEKIIFISSVPVWGHKNKSYGQIVMEIDKVYRKSNFQKEEPPGRVKYRQHIRREYWRIVKKAISHFKKLGYLNC